MLGLFWATLIPFFIGFARHDKVADYCRRDVEVTWKVYQFGQQNGYVQYRDRQWRVHKVPVRW